MNRKNLIISVDDFGLNAKANRNILELARMGKLDRVGVMAFGKYEPNDIEEILKTNVKLDIHLHMERFKSDAFQNKGLHQSLLTRIGKFVSLFAGSGQVDAVRLEWSAQFDEFRWMVGREPDGMNSHEHIHYFPPYFKLALEFQEKMSLPYFRFGKRGMIGKTLTAAILKFLSSLDAKILKKRSLSLPSSDYLVSFDWMNNPATDFENFPKDGKTEVLFHPEREDDFNFLKNS